MERRPCRPVRRHAGRECSACRMCFCQRTADRSWVGHHREIVLLALAASFFTTQAWGMVSQLGEASRKTVLVQAAAVSQSIAHLVLAAAAIYLGWLTVQAVMLLLIGEYVILVGLL